ncbi:MAG: hypothetical protein LBO75_02895 [Bifidobacteriaceae bacterium]|nr:hypothetical protein [Bifidobacteriaceae bacterium]
MAGGWKERQAIGISGSVNRVDVEQALEHARSASEAPLAEQVTAYEEALTALEALLAQAGPR